jgi:chromosome segregation ATPase
MIGRASLAARCMMVVAVPIWVTGCQTSEDPRSGGFVDGVVGLSTGKYDAFVEDRRDELETEQAAGTRLAERASGLAAEQARLEAEIARTTATLDRLDGRLASLRRNLSLNEAERERLAAAERDASDARQRLAQLSTGDGSVAGRQAEVEELQQVIGGIARVVEDLSG